MEGTLINLSFRQSWNNLVDLPANLSSVLYNANVSPQEVIVELVLQSQQKSYVGWSGMSSDGPKIVSMDPIFAHSLKLADKQLLTVNVKIRNPKTSTIFLEPEHSSDWELVELHSSYIESKLIEQSRCVALNQVLVVYPTKTSSVRLLVKDIGNPEFTYALIDPFAEISIAPKLKERKKRTSSHSVKSAKSNRSTHEDANVGPCVLKRGIGLPNDLFLEAQCKENSKAIEVYANLNELLHIFNRADFVSVSIVLGPSVKAEHPGLESNQKHNSGLTKDKDSVHLVENPNVIAKLVSYPSAPANTVGLSKDLATMLNVEGMIGFKVVLKAAVKNVSKRPSTFVIHPYIVQTKKTEAINLNSGLKGEVQSKLSQGISLFLYEKGNMITDSPITNMTRIPAIPGVLPYGGILCFKRIDDPYAWIKPYSLEGKTPPKIEIGQELPRASTFVENILQLDPSPLYGSDLTLDDIVDHIVSFNNSGIMLHGPSGCGKTLILQHATRKLRHCGFFVKFISCETIMNESIDQLCNNFSKWINEAVWYEPSVLILDNLDKILSAEVEHGDSSVSNQLSEFLNSHIQKVNSQNKTNISLLVSGVSKDSFNKALSLSHLIEDYIHLRAPQKIARHEILNEYLVNHLGCSIKFDIMDIVLETEGYLPNDLKVLSDRIFYECLYQKQLTNCRDLQLTVTKSMLEKAISGYQPSNLRGVKLQKSTTGWEDIGGLTEAKNVLLETLEWPTRYAPIFQNCPLRLRSGILLYGYPGCGKTLLASAIAGQSGLNFISIKGPEILNKYIGASEQSVRELFDRAQAAKPCILFFDEFDSIAPKRGHDSTGVTDRVVNQMLTQMDGAEGLDGVYVLAATSRPDLIDSALLRPGRLDKSIICDMPKFDDRFDILQRICLKMELSEDVDLRKVAQNTAGFSGADMQGLGYNAYLKAVHEKLAEQETVLASVSSDDKTYEFFQINSEKLKSRSLKPSDKVRLLHQIEKILSNPEGMFEGSGKKSDESLAVVIRQCHFDESLDETKPSISASEKAKLTKIYTQFSTGRDGNMPDGAASNDIGGRTTLM